MRILTNENTTFEMNNLPDEIDEMRFCVLDNSNPADPDYLFQPLIFLESFTDPAFVLRIGKDIIKVPYNWNILIGEKEYGDLEVILLTSINDRKFNAFVFNPLSDNKPDYVPIEIIDIYQDFKWYFPKMRNGQLLAIPLNTSSGSKCIYTVKEISKQCEVVDITLAW